MRNKTFTLVMNEQIGSNIDESNNYSIIVPTMYNMTDLVNFINRYSINESIVADNEKANIVIQSGLISSNEFKVNILVSGIDGIHRFITDSKFTGLYEEVFDFYKHVINSFFNEEDVTNRYNELVDKIYSLKQ